MEIRIIQHKSIIPDEFDLCSLIKLQNTYNLIKEISVMPDFHFKQKMEVPSSTTFAVDGHICLSLSSPEQNCGMTLVATPFSVDEMSDERLDKIFNEIRIRIPLPPRKHNLINKELLMQIFCKGAEAIINRSGINIDVLDSIEHHGNVIEDEDIDEISHTIPKELIDIALTTFCHIGDGNHFFEMQYVDEILDQDVCDGLGVLKDQIFIMYHSGSGYFGSRLGRYYAHRMKNTRRTHLDLYPRKIKFHLSDVHGAQSIIDRIRAYLLWDYFVFIPAHSPEGLRCILSIKASTNFGYANRASVLVNIGEVINKVVGMRHDKLSIFWDYSHNSIQLENVNEEPLWIHRHNTCRILPQSKLDSNNSKLLYGQPMFLPGTNTTCSYIGVSADGCGRTINSVDHGTGKTVEDFIRKGLSSISQHHYTRLYDYTSERPAMKQQYSCQGIEEIVSILQSNGIIKPIARLKPIAVLKG